nr:hypothetical protein [Tanacetum cinerariifolium]
RVFPAQEVILRCQTDDQNQWKAADLFETVQSLDPVNPGAVDQRPLMNVFAQMPVDRIGLIGARLILHRRYTQHGLRAVGTAQGDDAMRAHIHLPKYVLELFQGLTGCDAVERSVGVTKAAAQTRFQYKAQIADIRACLALSLLVQQAEQYA